MEKVLIIGGVAAGATAAAKARRLSPDAQITVLEAGPDISFANCGLPYYIGGDITSRSKLILQSPESFKDQYEVTVHTHRMAMNIDRRARTVTAVDTRSGDRYTHEYTRLILAQGGRPIAPPIPGADQDHVFSLWTLEDMDRINSFIQEKSPKNAVVVGGGFIGLEMVEALKKRGMEVHSVEMMPHVMAIMEAEIAGFIEQEMASYGVHLHTGRSVTRIGNTSVDLNSHETIHADMVLMSIGVRPTLKLAEEAGLKLGEAGGLRVDEYLRTSDENIFAAGDMVEIEHRVNGKKVRIPLAGPANRQGRIAADNALGAQHPYRGALGTSVVRVFEAVAGITGLSLKQARTLNIPADAVTVHKEHHTSYYPGSRPVTVLLVYNRETGVILGGQTAGYAGADKRLDVIATAAAAGMTIDQMADLDLAYSPPIGTANDAINMAAYAAQNRRSGHSPALLAPELDDFIIREKPQIIDVRDIFSYEKSHLKGAVNIPLELLAEKTADLDSSRPVLVYDATGKKGHQALRHLTGAGFTRVVNVSGGHSSLQRYARAAGFKHISLPLLSLEEKSLTESSHESDTPAGTETEPTLSDSGPLVIDVRTPEEFAGGAYAGAINIPMDELPDRVNELGSTDRQITLYCASGARSAYAQQMLANQGFTNVENGGGLMHMMMRG